MLHAVPKSIFSWGFQIYSDNVLLAVIDMSWLIEGGEFPYRNRTYYLRKKGMLSGNFSLESNGAIIAQAQKTPLWRHFEVQDHHEHYILAASSPMTRRFVLKQNERIIGDITPNHPFTRQCVINLPETISVPSRLFMFWLVLVMWRRAERASAG